MSERVFLVVGAAGDNAAAVAQALSGIEGRVVIVEDPTDWSATEARVAAALGVDIPDVAALKLDEEEKRERLCQMYALDPREPPDLCLAAIEPINRDHGAPRSIRETMRRPRRQKRGRR